MKSIFRVIILAGIFIVLSSCSKDESVSNSITCIDLDGNSYRTVRIGNQVWMAENLRVSHFRNGDLIPNITNGTTWMNTYTEALCDYNNFPQNAQTYGKLYNWYVIDDPRLLAPEGWHIPSLAEYQTLIAQVGGDTLGGNNLKMASSLWDPYIGINTNTSGFSAIPGGYRNFFQGVFAYLGQKAYFWTSGIPGDQSAFGIFLDGLNGAVNYSNYAKRVGMSIRCIKDQ